MCLHAHDFRQSMCSHRREKVILAVEESGRQVAPGVYRKLMWEARKGVEHKIDILPNLSMVIAFIVVSIAVCFTLFIYLLLAAVSNLRLPRS